MEVQLTSSDPDDTLKEYREQLSHSVFQARTLTEIEAAKQALHEWLQAHPDEPGMRDGFEVLSHAEDFAHAQAAGLYPSWEEIDTERIKTEPLIYAGSSLKVRV